MVRREEKRFSAFFLWREGGYGESLDCGRVRGMPAHSETTNSIKGDKPRKPARTAATCGIPKVQCKPTKLACHGKDPTNRTRRL